MKDQAFAICGVTENDYLDWCKRNDKKSYKQATKREFFAKIRSGKLVMDETTGKLITKRGKSR